MTTTEQLLAEGKAMLLRHGYHDVGVAALLDATDIPKGSFYHHFTSKEDFALQVIDLYMEEVHAGLDRCLQEGSLPPLQRARRFFELSAQKYRDEDTSVACSAVSDRSCPGSATYSAAR